ncbi:glycosyltransferase [Eggerthella sinensis]|uniref:glycosyltransferase n=1 Tax=Eggerthella sinensis TaxID=242230 RepID=UPI00266CDE3E|nr:glycosyltransferase [Eggerthella sinensis]
MDSQVVYWIGFAVALAFIVFGADDLLWDIYALFRGIGKKRVRLSLINEKPPKMLAVVIAAWHEDAVLGEVVDNLVGSAQYPRSLYRVFLGVYPNDAATIAVARALEARHEGTVVCVVGEDEGPTSKADNINYTVRAIRAYEQAHDVSFASVTIHDAEDVVHPNEFKMTNYLIDDFDALQFPVFPLQRMPRLRLFFKTLTSSTYADEFAEHHFRTMVMRDELGFVPSAGTGFAIGRRVLDAFEGEDLLPRNSLTEDYKLSLTLRMRGFRVHYVLEKVPRVDGRGRTVWDYIATRSLFPSTFKAAVRQKARWVYGITMQSANMGDVFGKSALTFAERTFLYKDLKAKFANFVLLPGYAVLVYFLVQTFAPQLHLPVMYPLYSFSWWMCVFLLFMMVERQVLRGRALVNVYGWRTMAFSILLPPLFPLRLLWGNLINMCATFRAWRQKAAYVLLRNREAKAAAAPVTEHRAKEPVAQAAAEAVPETAPEELADEAEADAQDGQDAQTTSGPTWNKTDHEFLPASVLERYRRLLGDALLERGFVEPGHLESAVGSAREHGVRLGQELLAQGLVEERHLTQAYALQQQSMYVRAAPDLVLPALVERLPREAAERFAPLPLVDAGKGWIVAVDDNLPAASRAELARVLGGRAFFLFSSTSDLLEAFEGALEGAGEEEGEMDGVDRASQPAAAAQLLERTQVELPQAGMALAYALHLGRSVDDVAREMGLAASRWRVEGADVSEDAAR